MYTDPKTVKTDEPTATQGRVFNRIGFPSYGASDWRIDNGEDGDLARMKISHQTVGSGAASRRRHMLRFEIDSVDGDEVGTHAPTVGYLVIDKPDHYYVVGGVSQIVKAIVGFVRNQDGETSPTPDYATNWELFVDGAI